VKKLLATCCALLFLAGFAQAQTCFDFNPYCDGLELTATGVNITGYWRNTDCAGTDITVVGKVKPSGDWYVRGSLVGYLWGFVIDQPLDGTMTMYQNAGAGWNVWIPNLFYDDYAGPCLFAVGDGESHVGPSILQMQER